MQAIDPETTLQLVRASYPLQQRMLNGHCWEYIVAGDGAPTLLALPGGLAVAETAFGWIATFAPQYRVLAPTYPSTIGSMEELVAGLVSLLDAEGVDRINIIGGSYSGLVAQCLVRAIPQRVQQLVLSDTGVPLSSRMWRHRAYATLIRSLPMPVTRWIFRQGMRAFLAPMQTHRCFWHDHFFHIITRLNRPRCLNNLAVWCDFDANYRFIPNDLSHWHGQILIINAEQDGIFSPREQRILHTLYPRARTFTLEHGTHCASLSRMDDYIAAASIFFNRSINA
ncbi:MAG: alpha/beta hydrolase [Chloroflexi bacterium AL-N5]|nr:alpha/beta hydrolase [Chloroflexi bacterium AL-N5]